MRNDIRAYYRALGLNPGAGPVEIRRAYRQLVQRWHPDLFKPGTPMQTTAEDISKEINEAYEQLVRRKLYRKFLPKQTQSARHAGEPDAGGTREAGASTGADGSAPSRDSDGSGTAGGRASAGANPGRRKRGGHQQKPAKGPRFGRVPWTRAAVILGLAVAAIPVWMEIRDSLPDGPAGAPAPSQVQMPRDPSPVATGRKPPAAGLAGAGPARLQSVPAAATLGGGPERPDFARAINGASPPPSRPNLAVQFERAGALLDVFEVGDTKAKVLAIQGSPDEAGDTVFRYGSSLVYFENGSVRGWSNRLPRLRVREWPTFNFVSADTFSLGSTRGEVVRAQGEPVQFTQRGYFYGSSAVYFDNERVSGWSEGDVLLRSFNLPILPFVDLDRPAPR